jgi:excisionase family DNA binding protein
MDDQSRVVVSPATAAMMLDVSRQQIYNLIAEGRLRRHHIGRSARIPVADIYALAGLAHRASSEEK